MKARDDLARARLAQQHVSTVKDDQKSKYRSIALKLPVLVHREGLAVALHFVAARGDEGQKPILDHLALQLGQGTRDGLLDWVRGLDATETRRQTEEVQRCLAWYKRLVQIGFAAEGDHAEGQ